MMWTCFDLNLYEDDDHIKAIATEIEAQSSEDAAMIFAEKKIDLLDLEFPKNVVVIGEGFRDIWLVELSMTRTFNASLLDSLEEVGDE